MSSSPATHVLVINAGSTSIRFALYTDSAAAPLWRGAISGIGSSATSFTVEGAPGLACQRRFPIPEYVTASNVLRDWVLEHVAAPSLRAIAYRVVYGGPVCCAMRAIDSDLLDELYQGAACQPGHLPQELHVIDMLGRAFPQASQLACFDSSFHATMPARAAMLPIPRQYHARGVRRYGFHGLSCAYLMRELARSAGPQAASGKVVIAHLGGGASVTAVHEGRSCDTSMGLTPSSGFMSGTRSGDLDPGLAWYLARREHMTPAAFQRMVSQESGLLGISGTSGDLRALLEREHSDSRAAEAVDMFCYQVRKAIWSMAGAMDGIDTLIFAGGVGAHAASIRERVCAGLSGLGVKLAGQGGGADGGRISAPNSGVAVWVMESDEESMIAEQAFEWVGLPASHVEPSETTREAAQ